MADPRFHRLGPPLSLRALADKTGARLGQNADPDRLMRDVASLEAAGEHDVAFLENLKYLPAFGTTRAGAAFVHPDYAERAPKALALLLTTKPYKSFALAARAFYPEPAAKPGIHPTAIIDPTARIGEGATVAPYAVIEARVEIGRRCRVGVGSVIGEACVLGDDVRIDAHVSVSHAIIGSRVTLFPGVRIGQDGFGFAPDSKGAVKVPQLGRVIIEDDVEIGANTTVDRGAGPDTVIGAGTMIDNLVQIGHNVQIGRGCILVAQVGISGSTKVGEGVMIGGQVGLAGHLVIGNGARIGAKSGVLRDVPPGITVVGSPASPVDEHVRQMAALHRLTRRKSE